jgi:hypothetical protein
VQQEACGAPPFRLTAQGKIDKVLAMIMHQIGIIICGIIIAS